MKGVKNENPGYHPNRRAAYRLPLRTCRGGALSKLEM